MARRNEQDNNSSDDDAIFSDEEGGMHVDGIYIPPAPKPCCSVESTGPRLIITKIVNDYFKSYAEDQTIGPLHKCFNAIVGPNGSGKSNVIDSMLFVFGYRSTKIRSKKLSVLLHNSEHYPNVQSCTVSVHFVRIIDKEGENYDAVPGSEFVVSRTAQKDNSSYYQLNGKRAHFKEIAVLLRDHGIDLVHNRFLILQGEVEQIATMKCKGATENETGMLEYLENIIGTTRFKKPLIQLEDKVETLSEQRSEKINRLKLTENELNDLQAPMEEALGFVELENTIIRNKNHLLQKNIYDLQKESVEQEEAKLQIEATLKELNEKLVTMESEMGTKGSLLEEESLKYNSLEKRKETMKTAFDKASAKDVELQAGMVNTNKNRKRDIQLLAEEKKKIEEYERVPENSERGIVEIEAKLTQLGTKHEKLEKEKNVLLSSLRSETEELQGMKEALQTDHIDLKKTVDATKSAYELAESEYNIYTRNEKSEQEKLNTLKTTYENAAATLQQRTKEIAKLKSTIPLTEQSLKNANKDLLAVKLQEGTLITEINKRRVAVEETKSSMMASKSKGRVLDALMKQKNEGKCPGLFGRLGDLGAIDQKYDVAISTACGPLDNIVVDTVGTAQWCIEFLKQYDVGRATFIALEKQEHLWNHVNTEIRTPENVPRLFDLIRVEDERVKTAFYYALRDTLVADSLDHASRIAYGAQRFRVVTLNGDLIETTGTMSGGGRQVSRGRMGQSVAVTQTDPQDVERMESDLKQIEQELRELSQKQNVFQNQINALEPELRQMKINLEKYTIELESLKQQVPLLEKQIEEQEIKAKATVADSKVVEELNNVVKIKEDAYNAAVADSSELQAKVDEYTKQINVKTTGKMKPVETEIKNVLKSMDTLNAEITRLKVAVKTAERNLTKSTEKISTLENDITKAENNLRSMKAERDEIEEDAKKLLTCIEELSAKLAEGEDAYSSLKQEVAAMKKQKNAIKSEKIEVEQKLKTLTVHLKDTTRKVEHWKAKLQQLKLNDIPNKAPETLDTLTEDELLNKDIATLQSELKANEDFLKTLKPDLNAIEDYNKKKKVFVQRSDELQELTDKRTKMKDVYESLRVRRKDEFMVGYGIIKIKLKEMYQMITLGGDADFELIDTYDPFAEGVQLNVRPPKKSWKHISHLSGGEKTLSSLALVFALHYYKPSPLYVMDEIDAALDFKNVSIIGNYIKERTKNAQFIIISLRSNMFELCDYLTGIYKTFNCTKSITIDARVYENNVQNNDPEAGPSAAET